MADNCNLSSQLNNTNMTSHEQATPEQAGRRVRFAEACQLYSVSKLTNKHEIWFARDETDLFKAEATRSTRTVQLQISQDQEPTASNILGLEKHLTIQLTAEYMVRRERLASRVLNEALRQRLYGVKDMDRMRRTSAQCSEWARERARASALFLEQDVEGELESERQDYLRWAETQSPTPTFQGSRSINATPSPSMEE